MHDWSLSSIPTKKLTKFQQWTYSGKENSSWPDYTIQFLLGGSLESIGCKRDTASFIIHGQVEFAVHVGGGDGGNLNTIER